MADGVGVQPDLAQWLLACIEEDELSAKAVTPLRHNFDMGGNRQDEVFTHGRLMFASEDGRSRPVSSGQERQHFARWEPQRVLAECDTKRRIIEECRYWYDKVNRQEDYPALADRFEVAMGVLRLMALPYADRDGYRPEWRL